MGKIEKSCVLNLAAKVHLRELVVCLSCRHSKHREMTRPENWKQSERFSLEKFLFEIKRVGCDSEKSEPSQLSETPRKSDLPESLN